MKHFEINEGETGLEGLLRTTQIMTKQLDWFTPRETSSWEVSFYVYNLIRHYIGMYDAIPKKQLMLFLLKYSEVTDLYNRVKEISERPHYLACMALIDDAHVSMKYFMSVYSPSRQTRRVFLMNQDTAEYYYNDYLNKFGHAHKQKCLENGTRTDSPYSDTYIWGEDISDSELFKRRLSGFVDKDTL